MAGAHGAAVGQPRQMPVDALAQRHAAGKVHVHAGRLGGQLFQFFVGQHPVIAAQAFAKRAVGDRGKPHHLDAWALGQLKCRAVGRLAGCAGQQHGAGTKELLVGQKVINEPRSDEQRPQQGLDVFAQGLVERVGVRAQVVVVDRMQPRAVRCAIAETGAAHAVRGQHGMGGHGPVAIQVFAHRYVRVPRRLHRAKAPHRNDPPARFAGGEELPVLQHLAHGRVGDVVAGECEPVHLDADLAVLQR